MKIKGKLDLQCVELTKLPIAVEYMLDEYPLVKHGLKIERIIEPAYIASIIRIKTYILAEEIDNRSKVVEFKASFPVYQSWWQHFKGEKFPEWLKRKFPPKFNYPTQTKRKKVTFRKYATYPQANILFPDKVGNLIRYKSTLLEEDLEEMG